jgi:hypothetical protein
MTTFTDAPRGRRDRRAQRFWERRPLVSPRRPPRRHQGALDIARRLPRSGSRAARVARPDWRARVVARQRLARRDARPRRRHPPARRVGGSGTDGSTRRWSSATSSSSGWSG